MKKIFVVIIILSLLLLFKDNNLKGKNVDLASKCHLKTTEEINVHQPEILPCSPFFIKL